MRNRLVGFIFQGFNPPAPLHCPFQCHAAHALLPQRPWTTHQERAAEALKSVGLEDRIHHRPTELSGGQQQRVAIARALVNNPSIIMADEPTGNLDTKSGGEIMELLLNLNKTLGTTLIIVTHDPEIGKLAQRIIRIRDGQVEEV